MTRLRTLLGAIGALLLISTGALAQGTVPFEFMNSKTANYTLLGSDCSKLVNFVSTGALTATLGQAGVTFFPGCFIDIKNAGTGSVTITPTTSTIDGQTTLVLAPQASVRLTNDGTNYFTTPKSPFWQTEVGTGSGATLGNLLPSCLPTGATPAAWLRIPGTGGRIYYVPGFFNSSCP